MTTTKFLALIIAVLLVLTGVAHIWKPHVDLKGRTKLVWVSDNNPARALQIQAFNEENPDLFLTLDYGNVGTQKVIMQSSSGVGPDIFDYSNETLETLVESGVLLDVTEEAAANGFAGGEVGYPGGVDTYIYNGRQYGFPCNTGSNILIYNKNVFDYFGVPYPEGILTWDQFAELARKVSTFANPKPDDKRTIFPISSMTWRFFFENRRGEYFTPEGMISIKDNPDLRTAFEMHKEFLKERFMPTSIETKSMSGQGGWGSGSLNQFTSGRFAMLITGHWSLIAFNRAYQQQVDALKNRGINESDIKNPLDRPVRLGAVVIPKFADRPPSYAVSSRVAGINSRSPNKDEAIKFLKYLSQATYSKLLNEGNDWLPGNKAYAELGVEPGPPALAREQLQATTVEAMHYGYVQKRSPFLLTSDVVRVLGEQISRMESNSNLSVETLLSAAETNLNTLMRRNLERNPDLKKLYIERFGEASYKNL